MKSDAEILIRSRGPSFGRNGMVATSQTIASQIGVDILKSGGSAVDAAIGANAMLSLAEPYMCGPGGDLFAMIWDPKLGKLVGLNGSGRSPQGLSYAALVSALGDECVIPGRGPLSLTVPGAVDGWCALHERYGRLPLAEVLSPAIAHSRDGVPIASRTAEHWKHSASAVLEDPVLENLTAPFIDVFLIDGSAPIAGQLYRNTELANTLEVIGEGGRHAFYQGEIATEIITYAQSLGMPFTPSDLAVQHYDWITPVHTSYRGYQVYELPPNGQGITVLQMLNLLEGYPLGDMGLSSPDYWHAFIEAKKLSFEDRARYYADPAFATVPTDQLIDKLYADKRRTLIDEKRAGTDYTYGDVTIAGSDTTYLSSADSEGMMVSLIQSIFSPFGAGLVPPGLGFALQCRGSGFSIEAGHPNVYVPGKRPFHTIIPAFVLKDERPWFSFGVMGADMQPQGQVQILVNMIDFGLDPQAAADMPRLRHFGGSQPNGARLDGLGVVLVEQGIDPAVIEELERRGHRIEINNNWITGFLGGYQGISYDTDLDVYVGGSESRTDGCAIGY